MATTIILVAHGSQISGSFSNPKVKIITQADQALSFDQAKEYLNGGYAPEFPSSSLGKFSGLNDADCVSLFGQRLEAGTGCVNTGKRRGNDVNGYQIFAWRGGDISLAEIGVFAQKQKYERVILVACRN